MHPHLTLLACLMKNFNVLMPFLTQKIRYYWSNLWNVMTTIVFDMVRIMTLKQQIFFRPIQSLSANFQKNCSPIQSWSGQTWLQSWSSPIPCSSLVCNIFRGVHGLDFTLFGSGLRCLQQEQEWDFLSCSWNRTGFGIWCLLQKRYWLFAGLIFTRTQTGFGFWLDSD